MQVEILTGCHAGCHEVGRCHTNGESEDHHKQEIHPGFETQDWHQQKWKTGVPVAQQKEVVSSKKIL